MAARKTTQNENEINEAVTPVENPAEQPAIDPMEELVTVQLFKDNDRYKDDVYVAVNGERILIQRGVPVEIKRKFAEVINHSLYQDGQTERMLTEMAERYEEKTREQK